MKTSKPISTISYNTPVFLQCRLDEMITRRIIDFYAFIHHHKEEDESKEHFHVYLVPNGQIDTDNWKDFFNEIDTKNPLKPLSIMPFKKSSKFGDWYLYSKHDTDYLATKMQSRKYQYGDKDFITSNFDYFLECKHEIDFSKYTKQRDLLARIQSSTDVVRMVQEGIIPIQQMQPYIQLVNNLNATNRNGRPNHEDIDTETGEIISLENLKEVAVPGKLPFSD